MRHGILLLGALLATVIGCAGDDDHDGLTVLMLEQCVFKGITFTDYEGNIIGPVDPTDWQIYAASFDPGLSSVPKVLPDGFGVEPAYPNPSDAFSLRLVLPERSTIEITIQDNDFRTVRHIEFIHDAGMVLYYLVGHDDLGRKLPCGIYRVRYRFKEHGLAGYGDVWLYRTGEGCYDPLQDRQQRY